MPSSQASGARPAMASQRARRVGTSKAWPLSPARAGSARATRHAWPNTVAAAIKDRYANEFQNAADPNLVVVNQTVSISGALVTETATCSPRLYGYTDAITMTVSASR